MPNNQSLRFSTNKIVILKILLDRKPKQICEINKIVNKLRKSEKGVSATANEIRRMVREGYISYQNMSVGFSSNNKYVVITDAGIEKYNELKEEFITYLQYLGRVNEYINS